MTKELNLRPYQVLIRDFILDNSRCAIWASMGTGKTSATLSALDILMLHDDSPVLIIAPKRVALSTWPDEVEKWSNFSHLTVSPIVGSVKQRVAAVSESAQIYTTNFENIAWLVEHWGDRWPYKTVVADEATKLKGLRLSFRTSSKGKEFLAGQGGVRAKALGLISHTKIKRFIELTGTPSPNGLLDLWGQIWFLDAGKALGRTFEGFKNRWFRPAHNGFGSIALPTAQVEIQNVLKDKCLTINSADWFDLKEPIINHVYVDLPVKVRKHYLEMEKNMFMELAAEPIEAFNAAAKTIKLQQICNGAVYRGENNKEYIELHDAKLEALESIIAEASGMPVLVSYTFKSDLARLLKAFPKGKAFDANPQTLKDWNKGKIPVMFAQPASAGHGISLQDGGNILAYYSSDWNLENHLQIAERLGPVRQLQSGYDRPVFVYHILVKDSVDDLILERLTSKREVQDILLEAMNNYKRKNR